MHWQEVWGGEEPRSRMVRAVLTPLSWLYALGWQSYLGIYRFGLKRPQEPHSPVVCIGNLTVGGSGKTPLVLHVAQVLREMGYPVTISASGYGSPRSEGASLAPDGELNALEWGDEPALIRWLLPDVPLIVGRRRVQAAEFCRTTYPGSVLLLDDGFQHLPLKKHASIVLDPPTANCRCLPAGPYREPAKNRRRADLVLPGRLEVAQEFLGFFRPDGEPAKPVEANVLCALGNPQTFLHALRRQGLQVKQERLLPDHDRLQAGNLFAGLSPEAPLVVTAKDWVKLRERSDLGRREILIARHQVRVEPADEFRNWLLHKLHESAPQKTRG
jgi:tetraacyldisaccharide 4'-kinase